MFKIEIVILHDTEDTLPGTVLYIHGSIKQIEWYQQWP
jgi:hypothetical protein